MIEQQQSSTTSSWPLLAVVAIGAAGVAWFLATDAAVYLSYTPEKYTDYYWPRRTGLILHISGGVLALTLGLVQVWLGLSGRTQALHRALGRAYVLAVLLGACGALYMAAAMPSGSPFYRVGLVGLFMAWVITTFTAYRFIRRGDVLRHRAWMIRSYVVTFGFVTLRVIMALIAALGLMTEDDASSPAAWLCWTVPLIVLEIGYRRWGWLPVSPPAAPTGVRRGPGGRAAHQ